MHNLWYYQELMQGLRGAIEEGRLESFARETLARLAEGPE
jgi:tRNA-guanine family transglycosylase